MATVKADRIEQCICGQTVAWVESSRGKPYPVDIRDGVDRDKFGRETAVVATNDFHYCALYQGLAAFLNRAIDRSGASRLRIRLLTANNEKVLVAWSGRPFANVTDGRHVDDATYYGSINLESGGFRASDDAPRGLFDLLVALDRHPAAAARGVWRSNWSMLFL